MSKFYAQWRRPRPKPKPWKVHPVWRGIGCFLIFLLPVLSYGLAEILVQANFQQRWVTIPRDMAGPASFPYLYVKLLVAAAVAVALFGLVTMIYALIYRIVGPSPYGPQDVPPLKRKPTRRRKGPGRRY